MKTTIALFGAAGKMGTRIADKLRGEPQHRMLYVESGEAGRARLQAQGLEATASEEAAPLADVVILAVPDIVLGKVAEGIVPALQSGGGKGGGAVEDPAQPGQLTVV